MYTHDAVLSGSATVVPTQLIVLQVNLGKKRRHYNNEKGNEKLLNCLVPETNLNSRI